MHADSPRQSRETAIQVGHQCQHRQSTAAGPEAYHILSAGTCWFRWPNADRCSAMLSVWDAEVAALTEYPELCKHTDLFPKDAIHRAKTLLSHVGSIGAYSHSQGLTHASSYPLRHCLA